MLVPDGAGATPLPRDGSASLAVAALDGAVVQRAGDAGLVVPAVHADGIACAQVPGGSMGGAGRVMGCGETHRLGLLGHERAGLAPVVHQWRWQLRLRRRESAAVAARAAAQAALFSAHQSRAVQSEEAVTR